VTVEMRRTFPDVEWNGEIESQQVDGRSFERMSLTDAESGRTEIVVLIRQVEDMELLCISTQLAGRTELLDEFLGGVFFLEAPLR
jgi:hypothetical protein